MAPTEDDEGPDIRISPPSLPVAIVVTVGLVLSAVGSTARAVILFADHEWLLGALNAATAAAFVVFAGLGVWYVHWRWSVRRAARSRRTEQPVRLVVVDVFDTPRGPLVVARRGKDEGPLRPGQTVKISDDEQVVIVAVDSVKDDGPDGVLVGLLVTAIDEPASEFAEWVEEQRAKYLSPERQAALDDMPRLWTRSSDAVTGYVRAAHDDRCTDPHDPTVTPCPVSDYLPGEEPK